MSYNLTSNFPSQKRPMSQKNEQWRKDCINGAEFNSLWRDSGIRQSYRNKKINYDLYSDILDVSDIEKICNPLGVMGLNAPAKMQNYPVCNPKIDLLVGESINRKFDFKVRVINDDAISEKEEELKEKLLDLITAHLQNPNITDEEMAEDMKKFENYKNFEYQDTKERIATQILSYLYKSQKLDYLFSKGFKDALIASEEIYQCDIIASEPVVKRLNPLNVYTVRSGESPFIEDSDIIAIVGYMSIGQIIDDYHEYLKPNEIDYIERGMVGNTGGTSGNGKLGIDIGRKPDLPLMVDGAIDVSFLSNDLSYGSLFDGSGNIRVIKVLWKSLRKVKKVKYFDEDNNVQYEIFDENYKIDKSKGEEEQILWISEWWEGHKIGGSAAGGDEEAVYVKMQPRPVQFRSMENPSKCHPGIVGTIYNTNDNVGVSLMDRMKPYQYLYNVLAYNSELSIAKNFGKIMRIDLASIPENWQIDQWLSFAQGMNAAFYDSFKEGNKGASQGKLAGGMSAQSPVIDMEMGNTIQLYMNMMAFIKQELGEISGVSQARQGQISNRAAVGNTEREVNQSSHITEYWFLEHDQVKLRVLECLLETAKAAWRNTRNKKVQYVLDDGATLMFEIDGVQFNESEYGLQITDGANSMRLLESMKDLAQAGIQNGIMNFSQLLDIYSTESISSIRRKIVKAENDKLQRDAEQGEREERMQIANLEANERLAESEKEFKREEWDREDARTAATLANNLEKAMIAKKENMIDTDADDNGIPDFISLEKLKMDAMKIDKEFKLKNKQLEEAQRHNKAMEKKSTSKS